ncbi:Uncharacterised protein [Streptococcus pneumoniae]|nr:Uncharacterised protein [Streptococcus pneumoniae]
MRKWTKGFLIFGVVTTVIGFILLFVGIQSDGIKSLLSMSKEPIYDSRTEKLTFGKEVENLEPKSFIPLSTRCNLQNP